MTITELIERLEEILESTEDSDLEVRLATQQNYPLQSYISTLTLFNGVLYIAEGSQVYESPYGSRAMWDGWDAQRDLEDDADHGPRGPYDDDPYRD